MKLLPELTSRRAAGSSLVLLHAQQEVRKLITGTHLSLVTHFPRLILERESGRKETGGVTHLLCY